MDSNDDYNVDFTHHNNDNKDISNETILRMAFEAAIILTLVVVFLFSCCGLLRKIRESYEQNEENRIQNMQNPSMFTVVVPTQTRNVNSSNDETTGGVFPTGPPPYAEFSDPPPKYDDIIKIAIVTPTVITNNQNPPIVHQPPPAYSA